MTGLPDTTQTTSPKTEPTAQMQSEVCHCLSPNFKDKIAVKNIPITAAIGSQRVLPAPAEM